VSIDAEVDKVAARFPTYSLEISIDPSGNGAKLNHWPDGLSGGNEVVGEWHVAVSPEEAIAAALAAAIRKGEA
jgi:hypothetical protein